MASIYCRGMPDPSASPDPRQATDPRALQRLLGRLAVADAAPWLHQEVARRMAERLQVIRQPPADWLDWWGFLGGGEGAVRAVWPQARRRVVEPGDVLARRSRDALRAPWWALHRRHSADRAVLREDEVPAGRAQMLWANLNLHLAVDPVATLAQWHQALAVDGFLMFSTYGPDTLRELRAVYAEAGWPAPHPPFVDMHDIGDQLVHAGFADPVMDQETLQLSWTSADTLLAELRTLGANLGPGRFPGLRTPRWHARLAQALARRADDQGRVALTVELVYGHAYKAAPRARRGEPATVSLDSVRASLAKARRGEGQR